MGPVDGRWSNRQLPEGLAGLGALDLALAASLARRSAGGYRSGAEERCYASRAVEGTPWRLVLAVPRSELYRPVDGPGRWVPWLVLVAFALAALLVVVQLSQHLGSRARRRLERELTHQRELYERLLLGLSALGRNTVRSTDLLARYGGEEFALLAPACPLEDVGFLADRLRSAVPGGATVSIGVAAWDGQESAEELVARADSALYAAKEGGRDRYVIA